ncbi:MAG: archease [Bacillota bacterium]|nr:archease [Bacillota bacterium]
MSRPYEVLEHTADVGIRARGRTLEEAFANAALGMMSLVVPEPGRVLEREERQVKVCAADLEGLLVGWLSEFVYLIDAERFLVARIEDVRIRRREAGRTTGRAAAQTTGQTAGRESWRSDGRAAAGCPDGEGPRGEGTAGAGPRDVVSSDFVGAPSWTVTALVRGEGIDPERHALEMEIKGVSYHLVKVERVGGPGRARAARETDGVVGDGNVQGAGWVAQAIFDV